jgi:outer membrane protein
MNLAPRVLAAALAVAGLPAWAAGQRTAPPTNGLGDTTVVGLPDMVRTAVRKNLALRGQRLSRDVADADLLAARAAFDPTWSLSLSRSTTSTSVVGDSVYDSGTNALSASLDGSLPTSTTFSVGASASNDFAHPIQSGIGAFPNNYSTGVSLGLTQPLLRGFGPGAATALVRSARHRSSAAGEDVKRFVEQTISQVEDAYYLLRFTETSEDIARASVQRAEALYARNTALRQRDLATELDVITARRTLAQRQTTLLDAQRQRVDAAEALMFLVYGQDAPETLKAEGANIRTSGESPGAPQVPDLDQMEKTALATRADVTAARDRLSSAQAELTLARSSLKPRLDLNLGLNYGGTSDLFRPFSYPRANNFRSTVLAFGASFSVPQFNRQAEAGYQQASVAVDQAQIDLYAVENQVRLEVRVAARGVQLEARSLQSADSLVTLAQHEYDIARSGLDLGEVTTFQLFQYESDLVAARLTRAQVQYNLATALSAYYLAEGDIGDRYGIDVTSAHGGGLP